MSSKILLISLIFVFLTPQNNYAEVLKMLKIFGKVSDFDLKDAKSDENCTQTCFSNSDCILAFFNEKSNCLLFSYNSTETLEVEETNRDDGLFVAFKTNLSTSDPNSCPSESEISPNIILNDYLITWIKTSDGKWLFRSCKLFQRSDPEITVCIQVFITHVGINEQEAKDYCSNLGWKMTGVANPEEPRWILKKSIELVPDQIAYQGIWIDGERIGGKFKWTDGYTEGDGALGTDSAYLSVTHHDTGEEENCLQVTKLEAKHGSAIINDFKCGNGTGLDVGVACGFKFD